MARRRRFMMTTQGEKVRYKAAEDSLQLKYVGPAVEDHTMEIETLAPALLHLAAAIKRTGEIVDPTSTPLSTHIKASSEGSFIIDMVIQAGILEGLWNDAKAFALGDETQAVKTMLEIGAMAVTSLVFLQQVGARFIRKLRKEPDGTTVAELSDGTQISVPPEITEVIKDQKAINEYREACKPATSEGIDSFTLSSRDAAVSITKEDAEGITSPAASEDQNEATTVLWVQPVRPSFTPTKNWDVTDGATNYSARMLDPNFETQTASADDQMEIELRTVQKHGPNGKITTSYFIDKVNKYIPSSSGEIQDGRSLF